MECAGRAAYTMSHTLSLYLPAMYPCLPTMMTDVDLAVPTYLSPCCRPGGCTNIILRRRSPAGALREQSLVTQGMQSDARAEKRRRAAGQAAAGTPSKKSRQAGAATGAAAGGTAQSLADASPATKKNALFGMKITKKVDEFDAYRIKCDKCGASRKAAFKDGLFLNGQLLCSECRPADPIPRRQRPPEGSSRDRHTKSAHTGSSSSSRSSGSRSNHRHRDTAASAGQAADRLGDIGDEEVFTSEADEVPRARPPQYKDFEPSRYDWQSPEVQRVWEELLAGTAAGRSLSLLNHIVSMKCSKYCNPDGVDGWTRVDEALEKLQVRRATAQPAAGGLPRRHCCCSRGCKCEDAAEWLPVVAGAGTAAQAR